MARVPNTGRPLPIQCPKCQHEGCVLLVRSLTVMTCTCAKCGHAWATELASLPPDVQAVERATLQVKGRQQQTAIFEIVGL